MVAALVAQRLGIRLWVRTMGRRLLIRLPCLPDRSSRLEQRHHSAMNHPVRVRSPVFSSDDSDSDEPVLTPPRAGSAPAKDHGAAPLSLVVQFLDALGANQFHRAQELAREILVHEPNNRLIREYSHVLAEHAQLLTDYNTPPKAAEAQNPEGTAATGQEAEEEDSSEEEESEEDEDDSEDDDEGEEGGGGAGEQAASPSEQGSARTDAQILAGIARVLRGTSLPALHEEERPALADEEDEEDEQGAGAP